jgi:hypothetical protein
MRVEKTRSGLIEVMTWTGTLSLVERPIAMVIATVARQARHGTKWPSE